MAIKRRTAFYTARRAKGLTQKQLAQLSGVPASVISELEQGKATNPSWSVLSRLAQVLGVRPEQLIPPGKLPRARAVVPVVADPLHDVMVA